MDEVRNAYVRNNMLKYEMLTDANKAKLLRRWKSIKEKAERNMAYGAGGSYVANRQDKNGEDTALPSLEKDRAMLPLIDEIITEILR